MTVRETWFLLGFAAAGPPWLGLLWLVSRSFRRAADRLEVLVDAYRGGP